MPIQRAKIAINQILGGTPLTSLPAGSVLQVQHRNHNPLFSTSSTSFVDINPLTTQITPKSSSSKILVRCILSYGAHDNDYNHEGRVIEDSTQVLRFHLRHEGGAANNVEETVGEILRSPNTTSQLTYKVQLKVEGSATVYLNRRRTDSTYTGQCTLTLMEVAQ